MEMPPNPHQVDLGVDASSSPYHCPYMGALASPHCSVLLGPQPPATGPLGGGDTGRPWGPGSSDDINFLLLQDENASHLKGTSEATNNKVQSYSNFHNPVR